MLDVLLHRQILLNLLKDIYSDRHIAPQLGFKGGTCLYFFHGLDRFSTDLDFDFLGDQKQFPLDDIASILKKYIQLEDAWEKHFTFFYIGSYEKSHHRVKVEISKRESSDEYEIRDLYGISVKCMTQPYLFANKLCAIHGRKALANRDLYDAHFMFSKPFDIAHEVIQKTIGLDTHAYFKKLISYIPKHISKRGILDGLGEVLPPEKKQWVKEKLLKELLFYLKSY